MERTRSAWFDVKRGNAVTRQRPGFSPKTGKNTQFSGTLLPIRRISIHTQPTQYGAIKIVRFGDCFTFASIRYS
jgi:hypothetical protein